MNTNDLRTLMITEKGMRILQHFYGSSAGIARTRILQAARRFEEEFGGGFSVYSAPGRTEIGGNHTDHQHGTVLAAAVDRDALAVAAPQEEGLVTVFSEGYGRIELSLSDLTVHPEEKGQTASLIRGIAKGFRDRGYEAGGFRAYITSNVPGGSGLSSSACFESLIGAILSDLYNGGSVSPVEIAKTGQYAENIYFGKPCGPMDQMACSLGGFQLIDFAEPKDPVTEEIPFDLAASGYRLIITDTKGSHADLTADYAAVPEEMRAAARVFGKDVLYGVTEKDILERASDIRKEAGDRAFLRALHFAGETKRAALEAEALKQGDMEAFLRIYRKSADSSFRYLQNIYAPADPSRQAVTVGLAVSDLILGEKGASRVHGGGFAGTIQAFVPQEICDIYQKRMDRLFGEGSSREYRIRKPGAGRLF